MAPYEARLQMCGLFMPIASTIQHAAGLFGKQVLQTILQLFDIAPEPSVQRFKRTTSLHCCRCNDYSARPNRSPCSIFSEQLGPSSNVISHWQWTKWRPPPLSARRLCHLGLLPPAPSPNLGPHLQTANAHLIC